METRGIRNKNVGNLRHGSKWKGLSSVQSDPAFCQFDSFEYGIRALIILLRTYYKKYHLITIRQIISRYAPENENNTNVYISHVSLGVGVTPDTPLSLSFTADDVILYTLVHSIAFIESNYIIDVPMFKRSIALL